MDWQDNYGYGNMQDPDMADEYLETAATMPSLLLKGEKPRLIDEWAHERNVDVEKIFNKGDSTEDSTLYETIG